MSEREIAIECVPTRPFARNLKRARMTVAICLFAAPATAYWLITNATLEVNPGTERPAALHQRPWPLSPVGPEASGNGRLESLSGIPASPPELVAGEVVTIGEGGVVSVTKTDQADLERRLAWVDPVRHLDGMALKDAVQLFNSYNVVKLEVRTPGLEQIRLNGTFHLGEPKKFAESLKPLGIDYVLQGSSSSADARILLSVSNTPLSRGR